MAINQLIVIGGGIAGLTCAESYSNLKPNDKITILSCSPILKTVCNIQKISKVLESFDVFESQFTDIEFKNPNISVVICDVESIDINQRIIKTDKGEFKYDYLSICSGAKPNLIKESPYLIGIRDTETIVDLKNRLSDAKRIVLIGNGGIALELIHEIKGCQIIWSIKDKHIGNAFFDKDAADFLFRSKQVKDKGKKEQNEKEGTNEEDELIAKNNNTSTPSNSSLYKSENGSALGPQWYSKYNFTTSDEYNKSNQEKKYNFNENVNIQYSTFLDEIYSKDDEKLKEELINNNNDNNEDDWPVYVKLSNGKLYGCNFIISATGVIPNSTILTKGNNSNNSNDIIKLSNDGAIIVNEQMKTSVDRIYASGDVCSIDWSESEVWFQMRLWSQARTQGRYTAQCIANESVKNTPQHDNLDQISTSFEFELFAHATKFFGFKVIMLGLYNGQGLNLNNINQQQQQHEENKENKENEDDIKIYTREIVGEQYVKVILKNGRLIGSLLIGDTDLEETFENLILNQIDLSRYGAEILNPEIDIEDYFD
ncbi:hypothetical protein RB653_009059 [Dictyostelium firmibasis]|uniref:Pyridine nucleotide-disulfide oxidoreductase domain-containing protein 1 n=1 Tax=Dictyostelium firmibasis TaxID=79012 RepID=A0AAN7TTH5_9MYCE